MSDDAAGPDVPLDVLANWSLIGRCYDVLLVDPLDIPAGAKYAMAFAFDDFEEIASGGGSKPVMTDHKPHPGGGYDQTMTELSSSSDFREFISAEGSVTVSDPTGALFSSTLSSSFASTTKSTRAEHSVVTLTSEKVSLYNLAVRLNDPGLLLSSTLLAAIAELPDEESSAYDDVVATFGTHVALDGLFGGRATQRVVVRRQDYETFLEQNVSLKVAATSAFRLTSRRLSRSRRGRGPARSRTSEARRSGRRRA